MIKHDPIHEYPMATLFNDGSKANFPSSVAKLDSVSDQSCCKHVFFHQVLHLADRFTGPDSKDRGFVDTKV